MQVLGQKREITFGRIFHAITFKKSGRMPSGKPYF